MIDRLTIAVVRARAWHLPLVLLVCAATYWPMLSGGWAGLRSSEGHRSIPGWTILHTGEWFPTRLFEASYLRKPPGMPWAVAVSSMVLGENEFAARAVSALAATLMAVMAYLMGKRWFGGSGFGSVAGLAAGLAQALLPRLWSSGRMAEIESLLCLTTQVSTLLLLDLLVFQREQAEKKSESQIANYKSGGAWWGWGVGCGVALFACLLTKGPAGLPMIGGAIGAVCIVNRSWKTLLSPRLLVPVGIALAGSAAIYFANAGKITGEPAETESVGHFLWSRDKLGGIATFGLQVAVSALPASLWLLFPWGKEAEAEPVDGPSKRMAKALGWSFVVAMGVSSVAGMSNPRYGIPALVPLAPVAGYVAVGCLTGFTARRRKWARVMCLGSPVVLFAVLAAALAAQLFWLEPINAARSTRASGIEVARAIDHDAQVWGAGVINAKPELMYYARREAAERRLNVRPLWVSSRIEAGELPPEGSYLVLTAKEGDRYLAAVNGGGEGTPVRLNRVLAGTADDMPFVLLLVEPGAK